MALLILLCVINQYRFTIRVQIIICNNKYDNFSQNMNLEQLLIDKLTINEMMIHVHEPEHIYYKW